MRILKVNGRIVDLDDQTAIGITFQSYDVTDPASRKTKISNTFSIPITSNNLDIFGYPGFVNSIDETVYSSMPCDYWQDQHHIFKSAKISLSELTNRISIRIVEKAEVWDLLKLLKWNDFLSEFFQWLSIPKIDTPVTDTFANFLYPYSIAIEGIVLPLTFSNLYGLERNEGTGDYIENPNSLWINYNGINQGGHFAVYFKTIFQWIEYKYNVNFLTSGGVLPGNIWDDYLAIQSHMPIRSLDVDFIYSSPTVNDFYFKLPTKPTFTPHDDLLELDGISLYDVVKVFFQHFNILIDNIDILGVPAIRLSRWDDIQNAEVVDWSDGMTGTPSFKPMIDGYTQNNKIKFENIFPDGATDLNSRTLLCLNKNIETKSNLFSISSYVAGSINVEGFSILDLSVSESFESFPFLVWSANSKSINVYIGDGVHELGANLMLKIPAIYSIDGEYQFLQQILLYPKSYKQDKWLRLDDILNLEFFKQYYIKSLGGCFFINKIPGYNPEKSLKATTLELIKISDKTPIYPDNIDYYTDGVTDYYTDGTGDYYF